MVLKTTVIDDFVDNIYPHRRSNYKGLAERVEETCKKALTNAGIQHFTTWRVKDKERLRDKLKKMQEREGEEGREWTTADIDRNVFDFAGVRIGLYRPEQNIEVGRIIREDCKFFLNPTDNRISSVNASSGRGDLPVESSPRYEADHYIVQKDQKELDGYDLHSEPVEIQVMSVLHSNWAQIQHDLIYKQLSGNLSSAEKHTLESFGRVMKLGESFLYQLSQIQKHRQDKVTATFKNIYDLGSFLSQWFQDKYDQEMEDLASLKTLKTLLTRLDRNNPKALGEVLMCLGPDSTHSMRKAKLCFPGMKLQPTVFIMHYLVTSNSEYLKSEWERRYCKENSRPEMEYHGKLNLIIRTLMLLADLFPPPDWENSLNLEPPLLVWLASTRPSRLISDPSNFLRNPNDRLRVDELLNFFERNEAPAFQLAFFISKYVSNQEVIEEISRFDRMVSMLAEVSRRHLEWN